MVEFLLCFVQYLLIFAVTVGVIACAVALGINLRKRKDAKEANSLVSEETDSSTEE